jgi:hypothetical protein
MGYYMNLKESYFHINKENKEKALEAIKKLIEHVDKLGGGFVSNNGIRTNHYAWVDMNFVNAETLTEAMKCWRWSLENEEGNIVNIQFEGEKLGDDEILFEAIAPFVEKGSYIEMRGEDGTHWRWIFDGEHCKEKTGRLSWDD